MKRIAVVATLLTGISFAVVGTADEKKVDASKLPPPAAKKDVTYARDIKPLFVKSCNECHNVKKSRGGVKLDSLEATLKSGGDTPIVVKGKSDKSRLVHSVAFLLDEYENMPPKGKGEPFTKEQIALLRAWIDQGAK